MGSGGGGSQGEIASDRVRFDTHVSYLDTSIPGPSSYLDTSSCSLLPGGSSAPPPQVAAAVTVVSALAAGSDNISSERSRLVIKVTHIQFKYDNFWCIKISEIIVYLLNSSIILPESIPFFCRK